MDVDGPRRRRLARGERWRATVPCVSMPIAFIGRNSKGALKQEMIEKAYLVPCRGDDPEVDEKMLAALSFTDNMSFDLDKKIWASGIGLSSWVVDENPAVTENNPRIQKLRDALFSDEPRNIIELGAGIGMLAIVLSVLRSRPRASQNSGDGKGRVVATNVESAMSLLKENISANSQYYQSTKPEAMVLDWDAEELSEEIQNLGAFDVIVMTDVAYNAESFGSLCKTLARLSHLGSKSPIIFLGYKEREEAERSFWKEFGRFGIGFEKVGERIGAGGPSVEIWAGRVRKS